LLNEHHTTNRLVSKQRCKQSDDVMSGRLHVVIAVSPAQQQVYLQPETYNLVIHDYSLRNQSFTVAGTDYLSTKSF